MWRATIAALIAASLASAPAMAADLPSFTNGSSRVDQGVFAGARFRVALGSKQESRTSAGLTIAATQRSRSADGEVTRRYAEGFEFGIASGDQRPAARLAGYRLSGGGRINERNRKMPLNTIETAAVVGGVLLLAGVIAALAIRSDDGCCE